MVCHDDGGPSHIEFIHSEQSVSQDNCGQVPLSQDGFVQSICTGLPCIDELVSFTSTVNSRRITTLDSLTDLFPHAPPLVTVDVHHPDSMLLIESDTDFETVFCLIELQCSIRTTVLVI